MSLISDALKTAQRERTGRNQSGKDQQPIIDGFFPYVSSAPKRGRSRIVPIVGISLGVIALLGITGWVMLKGSPRVSTSDAPPRIVLPPPVAVAKPTLVDSAKTTRDTQAVVEAESSTPSAGSGSQERAARQSPAAARPVLPRVAVPDANVAARSPEASIARPGEGIPRTPARSSEVAPRVDYEAQGTALFNAGDLLGAREKFQLATRTMPTARVWTNYGVTLQRLGDNAGASAAYQSAIGIDANYLEAWLYQGRIAADARDFVRAVPLFQRARAINPRNSEVNIELARLESELQNWTETRRFAQEAVRVDPLSYRGQWYLAIASDALKDAETAIGAYTAYLQNVGAAEREQAQYMGYARTRLATLRGKP